MTHPDALYQSELPHLKLLNRGKVRDIYDVDREHLLIVATDRLSAFDVVLPQPIPGKGEVLTRVANFWFRRTRDLIPNHLSQKPLAEVVPDADRRAALGDRAMVVRKLKPLPVEAVVRTAFRSLPPSGSVMPIEAMTSPEAILGSQRCFCASVPWRRI